MLYNRKKKNIAYLQALEVGYPRFIIHPYVKKLSQYFEEHYKINKDYMIILVSSIYDAYTIRNLFGIPHCNNISIITCLELGILVVQKDKELIHKILLHMQHTGCILSSRYAEDYLFNVGKIEKKPNEENDTQAYDRLWAKLKNCMQSKGYTWLPKETVDKMYESRKIDGKWQWVRIRSSPPPTEKTP